MAYKVLIDGREVGEAAPHGLDHSPLGLWNFASGSELVDSSGNGLTLSSAGSPGYSELVPGLRVAWMPPSPNSYLYRPANDASLTIQGAITVEFMCNLSSSPTTGVSVFFGGTAASEANNNQWDLRLNNGTFRTRIQHDGYVTEDIDYTTTAPYLLPTHVALTRNADGKTYKLYLNGVLDDTQVATNAPTGGTNSRLGICATVIPNNFLQCGICSLKVIGSELTPNEVKAEFNKTLGPIYGYAA